MLGNNINGKLNWDTLFTKYEPVIRNAFEFHDKYIQLAQRKIEDIKKLSLKYPKIRGCSTNKTKKPKIKKKLPEIEYVGVHVR